MLNMIISNEAWFSISQRKPIYESLSDFIKMNYIASNLVSVVSSGMFKYPK